MSKGIGRVALDCFFDLGVTVIYAAVAGVLIVAIVASDHGSASLLKVTLYASLLPVSVALLILVDLGLRLFFESRASRRRPRARIARSA